MISQFLPVQNTGASSQALCMLIQQASTGSRIELGWQFSSLNDATLVFVLDQPGDGKRIVDIENLLTICRRSREAEVAAVINAVTDRFAAGRDIRVNFKMHLLPDLRSLTMSECDDALRQLRGSVYPWPVGFGSFADADRLDIVLDFLAVPMKWARSDFEKWKCGSRETNISWGLYRLVQTSCPQLC